MKINMEPKNGGGWFKRCSFSIGSDFSSPKPMFETPAQCGFVSPRVPNGVSVLFYVVLTGKTRSLVGGRTNPFEGVKIS